MRNSQAVFLLVLVLGSVVQGLKEHKFLTTTLTKDDGENNGFITIKLKQAEITSKQKHEIFDFVSKSQNYLFSSQEKSALLSTDHKFHGASESKIQKISLYNFKNTQVLIDLEIPCFILFPSTLEPSLSAPLTTSSK